MRNSLLRFSPVVFCVITIGVYLSAAMVMELNSDSTQTNPKESSAILFYDNESNTLLIRYRMRLNKDYYAMHYHGKEKEWLKQFESLSLIPVKVKVLFVEEPQQSMSIIYQSSFLFKVSNSQVPNYPKCKKIIISADYFASSLPKICSNDEIILYIYIRWRFFRFPRVHK